MSEIDTTITHINDATQNNEKLVKCTQIEVDFKWLQVHEYKFRKKFVDDISSEYNYDNDDDDYDNDRETDEDVEDEDNDDNEDDDGEDEGAEGEIEGADIYD